MINVTILRNVTDEVMEAFGRLLPQLSESARRLDADDLRRLVEFDGNTILLARNETGIVGMLTVVTFPIPTGVRAWIEDVVVDSRARGQGVGAALVAEALRVAREARARTVDLTSRPSRAEANRLYERMGFARRESSLYRIRFP